MKKESKTITKTLIAIIIGICVIIAFNNPVKAVNGQDVYESLLTNNENEATSSGNAIHAQYVFNLMTKSAFWKSQAKSVDKVLMSLDEIKKLNQNIVDASGTKVYDLETIQKPLKTTTVEKFEKEGELRQLYADGKKINQQEYITKFENALQTSKFPDGTERGKKVYYAVVTKRADMKCWPTDEVIGYSKSDPDDESESYALNVNEPVVIRDVCVVDGKTFYYCQGKVCSGWINAENLAICSSKSEWTNSWKIDITKKDFLVVLQDKITLESSISQPDTSDVRLMLGTILKLVPKTSIPQNLGERGTWNNYVVYLPTRDKNGKYVKQYALISEHYNVSCGFIPMTQANILNVAFSCLGNRYGWGAMLGAMDCSAYTRAIYECFGLVLPRNTTWQQNTPGKVKDVSKMSDIEKQKYLETVPAGSLLYFTGHTMMYVGSYEGRAYVINAAGSLSDSEGAINVKSQYSIIINPLTVRRGSGKTWLNNISAVLSIVKPEFIQEKKKPKTIKLKTTSYTYNGKARKPEVSATDSNGKTISASNYTISYKDNKNVGIATAIIKFKGNYEGTKKLTFTIKPKGTSLNKVSAGKKKFKASWKKQKTQTTGYELQYARNSNFKSGKKIKITKNKITSSTIKKLKAKKKYYVRIRTYKNVNGNKICSDWSNSKSVKTKK